MHRISSCGDGFFLPVKIVRRGGAEFINLYMGGLKDSMKCHLGS